MKKFLKSDKGFAGVDISIAVIVVLILEIVKFILKK